MKSVFMILNLLLLSLTLQNHLVYTQSHHVSIAKLLNVSESEVPNLLANKKILIEGNRLLKPLLDATIFGGTYIDIKANKLNINTIDLSKNDIITNNPVMKPYLRLLSFVKVNKSLSELNSIFEELDILAEKYNATNFMLSNEYKVNNIVISLNHADDERNREFVEHANKLNPIIVYSDDYKKPGKPKIKVTSNSSILKPRNIDYIVFGGDGIYTREFIMYICTAGFWVRTTNLSTYLVSAGHCAINGSVDFYHLPWDSEIPDVYIGSLVSYTTSGVDRGFILKQNDSISVHPIIRNTEDQEHPVLYIIGTTDLDVGSIDTLVCKSGYLGFRHVECAKVLAVNVTVKMGDQRYGGVVKVDHMGCDGNSGAPVYQYLEELLPNVLLVGMLMGGNNIFCVVVPIKLILTEDMHVITINDP